MFYHTPGITGEPATTAGPAAERRVLVQSAGPGVSRGGGPGEDKSCVVLPLNLDLERRLSPSVRMKDRL
jgi:hypothetical protein